KNCEKEVEELREKYDGFQGHQQTGISEMVDKELGKELPHSMIATRLEVDGQVYGFIRCWVAMDGPAYYPLEDLELLRQASRPLARQIARWRIDHEHDAERDAWNKLAGTIPAEMPQRPESVQKLINEEKSEPGTDIFVDTLTLLERILPYAT